MRKVLSCFFLLSYLFLFPQQMITVTAEEIRNNFNRALLIAPACSSKYMENYTVFDSANVDSNNQYIFKVKAIRDGFPRPYKFAVTVKPQELYINSEVFYIGNYNQKIKFDAAKGKIYFSDNNLLSSDIQKYNSFFSIVKSLKSKVYEKYYRLVEAGSEKQDSLKFYKDEYLKLDEQENHLLLEYSKKNPKSKVLFWELANKAEAQYKPIFEEIFRDMDKSIINSNVGQIFINNLFLNKHFAAGNAFPSIELQGESIMGKLGDKFTLVEFWFSYCKPCLEAIPVYKEIYNKYRDAGFEYIGISTDRTQDIENWKRIISINNLIWQNFLDENGKISKQYNINIFPTTFLLDAEGKIVERDISVNELRVFLERTLK